MVSPWRLSPFDGVCKLFPESVLTDKYDLRLDQTSRIHGPHRRQTSAPHREAWHELARPQVHGYDVVGAEFISPLRFVSIADEKVARVFDAPKSFVAMVNSLGTVQAPLSMVRCLT